VQLLTRVSTEIGGYVVLLGRLCTTGWKSWPFYGHFVTAVSFRRKYLISWFFIHVNKK